MSLPVGKFYAGDDITVVLDLETYDPTATNSEGSAGDWIADTSHGNVTIALLSDDEITKVLSAVSATDDTEVDGRISATFDSTDTEALTPGYYRIDARRSTGPLTYDRPRIYVGRGRPA